MFIRTKATSVLPRKINLNTRREISKNYLKIVTSRDEARYLFVNF